MTNPSFEKFVMRTMHTQRYSRTLSDAFRDADYGTAIWRCESPNEKATDALLGFVVVFISGLVAGFFADIIVDWLVALATS